MFRKLREHNGQNDASNRSEDHGNVAVALDHSLKKLGVTYVDLYLMHWPQTLLETGEYFPVLFE